jgi:hypothetical protein
VFYAQFAGAVDKTHRIQACFRLVICLDVCKDSLIGKGETLQTEGGNKMSVLTLEDVVIEAATELAISGFCDVPVENKFGGVDLVPAGYYESRSFSNFLTTTFTNGVRFAIEDNVIHIYKAENFAIAASVSFKGSVSSSVLVAIAKEWL